MVGVQDEDAVQGAFQHRVHHVVFARCAEHHAQEVARVRQVIARIHVRLAHAVLVGHGDQGRHLGNQADGGDVAVLRIVDIRAVVIEGRERADQTGQHRHWVCIAAKASQEELHLLVHHGVVDHELVEVAALRRVGQLALEQQVAGVEVVALRGQLLDRVPAVEQLTLVAINVGDGRLAGGGRQKTWVVGEHARLSVQLADVDDIGADVALVHGQIHAGATVAERQGGFVVSELHCSIPLVRLL
jgi:hypothetical protein